jgi:alpha-ketoglutarate-dependent taurine dioxygenase
MQARTGFVKLGQTFAAEGFGFDLAEPLGAADVEAIEQGLAQYGVVVFRDQNLDVRQQTAFIRNFGPDRNAGFKEVAGANPMFVDVGTVDDQGQPIPWTVPADSISWPIGCGIPTARSSSARSA